MNDDNLSNEDLAPTPPEQRTWGRWDLAALWVGMSICIPTYGLAAGLVDQGWSLKIVLLSIALGNFVVLVPLVLNAHAGTRYGIPFPVFLRPAFGVLGANIPSLLRALVACGWFGIQTWIGGYAIYALCRVILPSGWDLPQPLPDWLGITSGQFLAFVAFWIVNVIIIARGIETIRVLERWAAPVLLAMGVALFAWAWYKVGDLGAILADPPLAAGQSRGSPWSALGIGLTSAVAFWGTLALSIPDFSRYARNQREQMVGQLVGLPSTMTIFVFIGAAVTNATFIVFHERIADPVKLIERIGGPALLIVAMFGLAVATLSTNLAANIVAPANAISNLAPRKISYRAGAFMAAGIGFVILPWKLWTDSQTYILTWLMGYGACLGSVGGVMIADYFLVRRCRLNVDDLYRRGGAYEYTGGFNIVAVVALVVGILPNIPGFLGALGVMQPRNFFTKLYEWGWFASFLTAVAVYYAGMQLFARKAVREARTVTDSEP